MMTSSCYFSKFLYSFGHFGKRGKGARVLIKEKNLSYWKSILGIFTYLSKVRISNL